LRVVRLISCVMVSTLVLAATEASFAAPLTEELRSLVKDHPQIKAARKAIESAGQEITKSKSAFYPTVNVTADTGPEYVDSPARRLDQSISVEGPDAKEWMRSRNVAGVTITQNLFNGFSTTSAVRSARLNRSVADFTMEGTRQNVIFEAVNAYVDVLKQKRLIELAGSNERNIQKQMNLEDERVQRGSGVQVDVLQAKSRLQIAKERRVTFEGALVDAASRFTQVFGHPPDTEALIDPTPLLDLIPEALEDAIDIASKENPAISNSQATVAVARERRRSVRSEFFRLLIWSGP
jgi:outer membrane protein, adhesin transport system